MDARAVIGAIRKAIIAAAMMQTLVAAPAESAGQLAEQIWTGLHEVHWEAPYRPGLANAHACSAVVTHPDLRGGLYGYEFYCVAQGSGVIAESFYFPADGTPPATLLRRADFRLEAPYAAMSQEVERLLKTRLTSSYGNGAIPDHLFEIGMAGPEPGLFWKAGEITIFLGHNRNYAAPAGVTEGVLLVAVRQKVLTERNLLRDLQKSFGLSTKLAQPAIAADLAKDLGTLYSAAQSEHQVLDALLELLNSSQEGSHEIRAAKLAAADDLAVRLGCLLILHSVNKGSEVLTEAADVALVRKKLARFGIQYTGPGHYSGDLEYDRSLLQRAWKEFPETPWGQRAFLMLQRLSCALNSDSAGPQQFRAVIRQGERFQETYPDSLFRKEELYHLALAYETWWSLSQAAPGDPTAEGAAIDKAAAERARLKAIRLYQELIRLAPTSVEARAGQIVLPRLKLRFATGERAFFCFTD